MTKRVHTFHKTSVRSKHYVLQQHLRYLETKKWHSLNLHLGETESGGGTDTRTVIINLLCRKEGRKKRGIIFHFFPRPPFIGCTSRLPILLHGSHPIPEPYSFSIEEKWNKSWLTCQKRLPLPADELCLPVPSLLMHPSVRSCGIYSRGFHDAIVLDSSHQNRKTCALKPSILRRESRPRTKPKLLNMYAFQTSEHVGMFFPHFCFHYLVLFCIIIFTWGHHKSLWQPVRLQLSNNQTPSSLSSPSSLCLYHELGSPQLLSQSKP